MIQDPARSTLLITGGAGFVGSSLALHWKGRHPGSRVIAIDNLKRRGSELNLPRLKQAGVEFVHGDVRNPGDLAGLPRIDALVECSAEPSVMAGYDGSTRYVVETNLIGTVNCLELVARDKADLVFLSTSRVYPMDTLNGACAVQLGRFAPNTNAVPGLSPQGVSEDFPLNGPRSLYGTTKLASELLIAEYAAIHGFRWVVDRCGVIAGPWQMGRTDQGFIILWLSRHLWDLPLRYTGYGGTGAQVRDALHVHDLCDLVYLQLVGMDNVHGRVLNAGGGAANADSLQGFTERCARLTGRHIAVGSDPADRPGDLKYYVTDNRRITALTGWTPQRDLDVLLSDSLAWLRQHEHELRVILTS
jgi:CDP-paratose 2-epimerase